jgi:hypothetical protein
VNRVSAKAAFEQFKLYVDYYGLTDEELFSEQNLVLMARHHGLTTSHLDFTVDPSVALFFAGSGEDIDGYSRIFFAPLNATFPWAKLCVPPVFAQRLYLQRGVLLDLPELECPGFHGQLVELRFPRGHSFVVYRKGKEITMFPDNPIDNFFEFLATASLAEQDYADTLITKPTYAAKLLKLSQTSPESVERGWQPFSSSEMKKISKCCLEDWDWVTAALIPSRIWLSDQGMDMDIDKEVVKALIHDNNYTYKKFFEEADEHMEAARRHGGWVEKLQQKVFNEFFEAMMEAQKDS